MIQEIKILAVAKSQQLLRVLCDFDPKTCPKVPLMKLKTLNLDVIQVIDGCTVIFAYYPNSPPSFMTVNLTYIDMLKKIVKSESILNPKYCDIDSSFGLHDYTISIELRNQRSLFFSEIFRKVFTKAEDIEKTRTSSWANFYLLQSEHGDRYYNQNYRFEGRPFYQFDNLIMQNEKIYEMCILDIVMIDEFNEPFYYGSQPVNIKKKALFQNQLNMDMQGT